MGISIDLMVEAKAKEQAIFGLYKKYGDDGFLKNVDKNVDKKDVDKKCK